MLIQLPSLLHRYVCLSEPRKRFKSRH